MLIDTHAHLNFVSYQRDRKEVIRRCLENNIWVINVGSNFKTSQKAVDITHQYPQGMYATVGLHPINLDTELVKKQEDENEDAHYEKEFDYEGYKKLASSPKVLAIGEIGLDYYRKPKTKKKRRVFKEKQKSLLAEELELAKELNLPVIFHCRMAHQDLIGFLKENPDLRPEKAVVHSFVGNMEEAKAYLDFGFYIGFNGIIFKNISGIDFEKVIKATPLDRLLVETDSPYLLPPLPKDVVAKSGRRISQRNEPLFVKFVAQEVARIKSLDLKKVARFTTQNAKDLFSII